MPEIIQDRLPLVPLAYALLGYFCLQIILSILIRVWRQRVRAQPISLVTSAFWASIISALYLVVISVLLHIWNLAPNAERPPANMLWWGLAGVPLGVLLWYLLVMMRRLGIAVFGSSQLVAAEDAILNIIPHPRYLSWGLINLGVIQPLGRELFMRGVFLPVVALNLGWGWAVGTTLVIELWMRMNVVWFFANALYVFMMCGLFYLSGNALCGLVAASIAGLIHGIALAYVAVKTVTDNAR